MFRLAQFGIVVSMLGMMLTFIGLFPGVAGFDPTPGIGIVQVVTILIGFSLLIVGAFIYVKYTFYPYDKATLAQEIALRLSMTGLLFASMAAFADILGFGSNVRTADSDLFFGPWQAIGLFGSFLLASLGVLLYALMGHAEDENDPS